MLMNLVPGVVPCSKDTFGGNKRLTAFGDIVG